MAPIDGIDVTRDNAGEFLKHYLLKDITKEELMNLVASKSETDKKALKESLLNKLNMTPKDNENMQKCITYLEENHMDTEENLEKLKAIIYGSNYIEIGGVKFSREKLVPPVKFNNEPNKYGVFESNKSGIFKTIYNGKEEYYLTPDAYIEESKIQGKKVITYDHIRKTLQVLPGEYSDNNRCEGANILGNILNLSISGCVDPNGGFWTDHGHLCSASGVDKGATRAFVFDEAYGRLFFHWHRDMARPCLFVVE